MKKIKLRHVFKLAQILDRTDALEHLEPLIIQTTNLSAYQGSDKFQKMTDLGVKMVTTLLQKAGRAEGEIVALLSDIWEVDDANDLDIEEVIELAKEMVEKNNIIDFFKQAQALTLQK